MIRIKMSGTATAILAASNGYLSFGDIKATGITPCIKRVAFGSYVGSLRVNAESGKIQLGYTSKQGTSADIPKSTAILIDETIMLM